MNRSSLVILVACVAFGAGIVLGAGSTRQQTPNVPLQQQQQSGPVATVHSQLDIVSCAVNITPPEIPLAVD